MLILGLAFLKCQLSLCLEVGQRLGEWSDPFEDSTVLDKCQQIQGLYLVIAPTEIFGHWL